MRQIITILNTRVNKSLHALKSFWLRYKKNRGAVLGLLLVFIMLAMALFAPLISTRDPFKLGEETFEPPSLKYLFGTDDLGRDMFSMVLYGARVSFLVGFLSALTSALIGLFVGAFSGYYGGILDDFLMRTTEVFQTIPRFFMSLLLVALFGSTVWNIIIAIGILTWPSTARLVRAEFLSLKEKEFVEAARALGDSNLGIIFGEILPNAVPSIVINTSLQVGGAIILESALSFLLLGDPTLVSWGRLLANAQMFIRRAWWMAVFPGLALFVTILGINLMGDGLNDVLNPRLKER